MESRTARAVKMSGDDGNQGMPRMCRAGLQWLCFLRRVLLVFSGRLWSGLD
jgi:hypothetical protein